MASKVNKKFFYINLFMYFNMLLNRYIFFRWLKGWLIWEPVWKSDAVGLIWLLYIMLHISMCRQFLRLFWKLVKYVVCKIKISKKVKLLQKKSWKIITLFSHTKNKICQNKKNMQFDEKMKKKFIFYFIFCLGYWCWYYLRRIWKWYRTTYCCC